VNYDRKKFYNIWPKLRLHQKGGLVEAEKTTEGEGSVQLTSYCFVNKVNIRVFHFRLAEDGSQKFFSSEINPENPG
jgi:hypothetical protein